MVGVLRAAELKVSGRFMRTYTNLSYMNYKYLPIHAGAPQHPSSSAPTKSDHHGQSSQLVELCKKFKLSDEDIDKEVDDDHILEIYPQLKKWRLVAAHLKVDVEAIETRARGDEELMRLYTLQEWKKEKRLDGSATYQVLLQVLIKCKCSESALRVCELLP